MFCKKPGHYHYLFFFTCAHPREDRKNEMQICKTITIILNFTLKKKEKKILSGEGAHKVWLLKVAIF